MDKRSKTSASVLGSGVISRRGLLAGLGGVGAAGILGRGLFRDSADATPLLADQATGSLPIPKLLAPEHDRGVKVFRMTMRPGTAVLREGRTSVTAGFNGPYLGPVIRVRKGDQVRMEVTNQLAADTTVHWHGAHLPPSVDGGPQNTFAPGTTWKPQFTINQNACTLWFHPHGLGTTTVQVASGLAGMLLVEDDSAGVAALPHRYGVDQFPVILQSVPMEPDGTIPTDLPGLISDTLISELVVNGVGVAPAVPRLNVATSRIRLHLLNASTSDTIAVSRTEGTLTQVATDAALLPAPAAVTHLQLAPGERAEVVLDLTGPVTLQARKTDSFGVVDAEATPFLTVTTTATGQLKPLPERLNHIRPLDLTNATPRDIVLSDSDGGFAQMINGVAATDMDTMMAKAIMTRLGATEVWTRPGLSVGVPS